MLSVIARLVAAVCSVSQFGDFGAGVHILGLVDGLNDTQVSILISIQADHILRWPASRCRNEEAGVLGEEGTERA